MLVWSVETSVHRVAIPYLLQEKRRPETAVKIFGDPKVISKVMAFSNRDSGPEHRDLGVTD
jgi:hypothetical protein